MASVKNDISTHVSRADDVEDYARHMERSLLSNDGIAFEDTLSTRNSMISSLREWLRAAKEKKVWDALRTTNQARLLVLADTADELTTDLVSERERDCLLNFAAMLGHTSSVAKLLSLGACPSRNVPGTLDCAYRIVWRKAEICDKMHGGDDNAECAFLKNDVVLVNRFWTDYLLSDPTETTFDACLKLAKYNRWRLCVGVIKRYAATGERACRCKKCKLVFTNGTSEMESNKNVTVKRLSHKRSGREPFIGHTLRLGLSKRQRATHTVTSKH